MLVVYIGKIKVAENRKRTPLHTRPDLKGARSFSSSFTIDASLPSNHSASMETCAVSRCLQDTAHFNQVRCCRYRMTEVRSPGEMDCEKTGED